jgi:light-regulated signal transduction histidine kinase (bacteriophytochrome)
MYSQIKEPNENITNYYHKTTQASKRLSVMIDELLSFSRLGRKHLSLNNVDLNEIVKEAIANLKPDWINRQIDWKIGMLPTVKSDKALMLIVLTILISNAIKYTSKKDTATIENWKHSQ